MLPFLIFLVASRISCCAASVPACGRRAIVPVLAAEKDPVAYEVPFGGKFHADGVVGKEDLVHPEGYSLQLKQGCQIQLRENSDIADCLRGNWLVVSGASSAMIWYVQLVNMLSAEGLNTHRDHFNIDGVFTQLVDVVIEDGKIVHRQIDIDEEWKKTNRRAGMYDRMQVTLPHVFKNVSRAPAYSPKAIRLTYFLAVCS